MRRLERYRHGLESAGRRVPNVDPLDGGADARLLILLETPGPGAEPLRFVSRDNPTGTARNLRRFLAAAGIARADTLLWNVVPWIVHAPGARNRPLRRAEITAGIASLPGLIERLPRLAVAVLAGRPAGEAMPALRALRPELPILVMPHPSPTFVCTSPAVSARIRETLADAAALLEGPRAAR